MAGIWARALGRWLLPALLGAVSVGAVAPPREFLVAEAAFLFQRLNPTVTDIRRPSLSWEVVPGTGEAVLSEPRS